MNPKHIIYFDGYCGLCHKSVQFVLKNDKKSIIFFSPLSSAFSKKDLINTDQADDTFYIKSNGQLYQKSEAWIVTLNLLGGFWKIVAIAAKQLPSEFLNNCYDFIAKHRKKIFGSKDNCDLLSREQKDRFIF